MADSASSRFFALPQTTAGRWCGRLLLFAVALAVLNTAVVMPITERGGGASSGQLAFNAVVFLSLAAAGVLGLFALAAKRERSWVAVLASALLLVALAMLVQDLVTPG